MKKIAILLLTLICLHASAQITTYNINRTFSCTDTIQPFGSNANSYGISIDGSGQLLSDSAFIRVVLVDNNGNEWLVYERNSLYSTEANNQFQGAAMETAALYNIVPSSIIVTLFDATLFLANAKSNRTFTNKSLVTAISDSVFLARNLQIVDRINAKLSAHKKAWRADTTFLSNLRYREKKAMFGNDLPNLQGWDYYVYGYYSPLNDNTPPASDNIVKEFDWRTRHGSQNSGTYYYNSEGSGWIPRWLYGQTRAECWAFTTKYTTEAIVNLYFNRQLNETLSVQDILSCSGAGTWDYGGQTHEALDYVANEGIVDDNCFPFYAQQTIPCSSSLKCENPTEIVSIAGRSDYLLGEDTIKYNLITKGVLAAVVNKWGHAMSMVGFGVVKAGDPILYGNFNAGTGHDFVVEEDSPDIGKPYYIFKQSYATYGYDESHFCKIIIDANHNSHVFSHPYEYLNYYLWAFSISTPITSLLYDDGDIDCVDNDGDGYYNWGIGPKPATCPNCPNAEDCDDSTPLIGPYNEKYECMILCENYAYSSTPEYITGQTLWGSETYIDHDVIVENGGVLTIENTVFMGESTKIIVKPGGRLMLDYRAVLTGFCGAMWEGVEVWGNSSTHQQEVNGSYLQGYIELKNGAVIENAKCAVELWRPGFYSTTGGIIHATGATFRNNAKAVHALYYTYSPSGGTSDYNGYLRNCTFTIDEDYLGTETFSKHVDLSHISGFDIEGCSFSTMRNVTGVSPYCVGIGAYTASFRVNSYCDHPNANNMTACPEENLVPCSFTNFYQGIHASGDGGRACSFRVENAVFNNNTCGLYALNTGHGIVVNNDFTVGCGWDCDFGIYADGVSSFCIEDNTFHPKVTNTGSPYGIAVVNSNSINDVYNNDFQDLRCGNVAIGDNNVVGNVPSLIPPGLTYTCNTNSGNIIDFCVLKDGNTGGVASPQGSTTLPAGNTFGGTQYHFYNEGDPVILYYYDSNDPSQIPAGLSLYQVSANGILYSNSCQSHYNGGSVTKSAAEKAALASEYLSARSTYNSLLQLYESRIDGGSTPAQVTDINTATPSDLWQLRAQLLGISPYVSDEVLTTAADRYDVFTDPVLFEILAANPDELRKDSLISYLETKDHPLPTYMTDLLREMASGFTARTALLGQMAQYGHDFRLAAGDIVRSCLNDSVTDLTELRTWLANMDDIASDRMIVASYLQEGDSVHAFGLANMLPELYGLQGDALADHTDYMRLIELYQTLNRESRNVNALTDTELSMVNGIAASGTGTSKTMAEAILMERSDENILSSECPTMPGNRGSASFKDTSLNEAMGFTASVSPNPATTWTTVEYTLPADKSQASFSVTNTLGVIVMSTELNGKQGQKVLDLHGLADGVYFYTIRCGEYTTTGKLVITK